MSDARWWCRWTLLDATDIGTDGDPYLDRLRIVQTPLFSVYLHHIHRLDIEADPHDHPWSFWSMPICGGYRERVWPDKRNPANYVTRERNRFAGARRGRRCAHMITSVRGPLWTLVITGPKRGSWGFWRDGTFTDWQRYSYAEAPPR